jgi:nitroreductase
MPDAEAVTAETWARLVERAAWAPSPHNTQPWLVHPLSADQAELYVPAERTLPDTDRGGAFMTSALGIFVEALDVAAAAEGLAISAEPLFPNVGAGAAPRALFARLRLAPRSEPQTYSVDLLERRRTARGRFDGRPAAEDALAALAAIAREAGHEARFTGERDVVDWVVGLNADTLFYDLDDDLIRSEIGHWVRRSNREARERRDGFSPACLGFPGPLVSLFFFHHRLFASRAVRRLVRRLFLRTTRGTSTVGWIQGPWTSPEDQYDAGRMFMRFWLQLTRHGLYLQPFGSVITNPTAHALMAERLKVDESRGEIWLLLRVGYCPPPPRSLRRRVAEVIE